MPSKEDHFSIIEHNHDVLKHLTQPVCSNYTDWCVTIIFYMALHFIHAYLAKDDNHPSSHADLQNIIPKDLNLKPLYHKYKHLADDSRKARYDGTMLTVYEMRSQHLSWFKDIQTHVHTLVRTDSSNKYDLYPLFPLS